MVTKSRAGRVRSRGSNSCSGKRFHFSLLQCVQTSSGTHPATCSMGTADICPQQSGWRTKLTVHLHLMPRLRMSEATHPLCSHSVHKESFTFTFIYEYLNSIHPTVGLLCSISFSHKNFLCISPQRKTQQKQEAAYTIVVTNCTCPLTIRNQGRTRFPFPLWLTTLVLLRLGSFSNFTELH
jgi:hypothetical protein